MAPGQTTGHESPRVVLEKRGAIWYKREQNRDIPVKPAELRRIMFPDLEGMTEADVLAVLVKRYRWTWVSKDSLRRFNPFGVDIRQVVEQSDAA